MPQGQVLSKQRPAKQKRRKQRRWVASTFREETNSLSISIINLIKRSKVRNRLQVIRCGSSRVIRSWRLQKMDFFVDPDLVCLEGSKSENEGFPLFFKFTSNAPVLRKFPTSSDRQGTTSRLPLWIQIRSRRELYVWSFNTVILRTSGCTTIMTPCLHIIIRNDRGGCIPNSCIA